MYLFFWDICYKIVVVSLRIRVVSFFGVNVMNLSFLDILAMQEKKERKQPDMMWLT